jgi:hypothetical protein
MVPCTFKSSIWSFALLARKMTSGISTSHSSYVAGLGPIHACGKRQIHPGMFVKREARGGGRFAMGTTRWGARRHSLTCDKAGWLPSRNARYRAACPGVNVGQVGSCGAIARDPNRYPDRSQIGIQRVHQRFHALSEYTWKHRALIPGHQHSYAANRGPHSSPEFPSKRNVAEHMVYFIFLSLNS